MSLHAVIMAGGSGTRFWPASRKKRPKQFLPLAQGKPLLQQSLERAHALAGPERSWIITNPLQAQEIPTLLEHAPGTPRPRVIVEPEARDTAPCAALATATVEVEEPGSVIALMPADQLIQPVEAFADLLRQGAGIARDGSTLVTFGIPPSHPAQGFGYIELGEKRGSTSGAYEVLRFREKPDLARAREFVASGRFLWNSGIFLWTYEALLGAMSVASAELASNTEQMRQALLRGDRAALEQAFRSCPRTSIDYALMERAPQVTVLRVEFDWHDVGSFAALGDVTPKDEGGNVQVLSDGAQLFLQDSKDCTVYAEGNRTVALLGTTDLVVVAVEDAILICPKERSENLKQLVEGLRKAGREDLL